MQAVLASGIHSLAVVLKHAAVFPNHECAVGKLAQELGFEQVRVCALGYMRSCMMYLQDVMHSSSLFYKLFLDAPLLGFVAVVDKIVYIKYPPSCTIVLRLDKIPKSRQSYTLAALLQIPLSHKNHAIDQRPNCLMFCVLVIFDTQTSDPLTYFHSNPHMFPL